MYFDEAFDTNKPGWLVDLLLDSFGIVNNVRSKPPTEKCASHDLPASTTPNSTKTSTTIKEFLIALVRRVDPNGDGVDLDDLAKWYCGE